MAVVALNRKHSVKLTQLAYLAISWLRVILLDQQILIRGILMSKVVISRVRFGHHLKILFF